jgi:hypothetical protein
MHRGIGEEFADSNRSVRDDRIARLRLALVISFSGR